MARGRGRNGLVTSCPACGAEMFFRRRPTRGQFVTCHNCDSLLEVLHLSPLELEWAFEDPLDVVYRERHQDGDEWEPDDYESYEAYEDPETYDEPFNGRDSDRYSDREQDQDDGHKSRSAGRGNGRGDGYGNSHGNSHGY